MTPYYQDDNVTLHAGDCLDVLKTLADNSIDAVVCDPPYGLEFMGKDWDSFGSKPSSAKFRQRPDWCGKPGQAGATRPDAYHAGAPFQSWCELWATECLRVLKPGGHMLAFGGTRTWHRLACAVEDAGFEIRDSIAWLYGSGFPKSLDVSKAIDKARDDRDDILAVTSWLADHAEAQGITRADIDARMGTSDMGGWWLSKLRHRCQCPKWEQWLQLKALLSLSDDMDAEVWRLNGRKGTPGEAWDQRPITQEATRPLVSGETISFDQRASTERERRDIPATDAAKQWQGYGTALKPAFEPIVVARKPIRGTVAANVQAWGTGALNVDGCRVQYQSDADKASAKPGGEATSFNGHLAGKAQSCQSHTATESSTTAEMMQPSANSTTAESALTADGTARKAFTPNQSDAGRWPANVVLDGDMADELDKQSGSVGGSSGLRQNNPIVHKSTNLGGSPEAWTTTGYDDSGGASRFFPTFRYTAKAPGTERPTAKGVSGELVAHPT